MGKVVRLWKVAVAFSQVKNFQLLWKSHTLPKKGTDPFTQPPLFSPPLPPPLSLLLHHTKRSPGLPPPPLNSPSSSGQDIGT